MFNYLINKCKNGWLKLIEQILNVLLKNEPIKNIELQYIFKMTISYFKCQSLIKNIKYIFFNPCISQIFKLLEYNLITKKINV
jgi:hypothetical protein